MAPLVANHTSGEPKRLRRWSLLILILLGGAFLRLHALDQLPPGLYYDEAFDALDAQHVLHAGPLVLFFAGNSGREPLHMYLLAGAMALLGEHTFSLRLTTAFVGLLSVPLTYCAARALLRPARPRAVWAALLAAALVAVSYWPINFSRILFRAIDLVPLSLLAIWLLWRGVRKQSLRLYVFSGVALGLSQYTYLAARLLPVVFAGLAAAQAAQAWLLDGHSPRAAVRLPVVRGIVVSLFTAALVFAPLAADYALHPAYFSSRTSGLSIFSPHPAMPDATARPPTLASNLLAVTRMFIDQGDNLLRNNLPGRPAADVVGLVGFWVGLALAVVGLRRPQSQLFLLWLGAMLLPTVLSIEAPHFLRAIGAIPAVFLLAGDGLARLGNWLGRRRPWVWPALVIGLTLSSGGLTYYDYFVRWPLDPRLADQFDVAPYTLAQEALALSGTADVVLPIELYTQPSALFVLEPVFPHLTPLEAVRLGQRPVVLITLPGAVPHSLVVLRRLPGQPGLALVTRPLEPGAFDQLSHWPAERAVRDAWGHVSGVVKAGVAALIPTSARPTHALDVTFADTFHLTGYDLHADRLQPGATLELQLYWQSLRWAAEDYSTFLQLQSVGGDNRGQRDGQLGGRYVSTLWRPGNLVTEYYTLTVPSGLQPGKYRLVFGLYEPGTISRLAAQGPSGPLDSAVTIATISVPDPTLDLGAIPNRQQISAGDPALFNLIGYERAAPAPDHTLAVTLYWQAVAPISEDYTIFVHILDAHGALLAQQDGQPVDGRAPTSAWVPGEVFKDVHRVSLPPDLPPGTYTVAIGAYFLATGARLPLFAARGARLADDHWLLPEPVAASTLAP